jgi:membrane-bound lytic murein transglycosylase D
MELQGQKKPEINLTNSSKPKSFKRSFNLKQLASVFLVTIAAMAIFSMLSSSITNESEDKQFKQEFADNYKVFSFPLPENLDFANEKVPLHLFDIHEKMDRELLVNTYWQSQTLLFIKRANRYFPLIEEILKREGVPQDFKYLALIESGFTHVVSPAGATGFWQIMKTTGIEYGLEINAEVDERYNIEKSTLVACKYLKQAYRKFGNWTMAAASYNMGIAGLEKQVKRQNSNNYYNLLLNEETSRYLFRILAIKEILQKPENYGFTYRNKDLYTPIEFYEIEVAEPINDLAQFAENKSINYKLLKILNPWLRDNKLTNKDLKTYSIKMPKGKFARIEANVGKINIEEINMESLDTVKSERINDAPRD